MFQLSLRKNLQFSKLYIIFGTILRLLKAPTVPRYWTKLTGIGYKEWRFAAAWTTDMYTISDKKWIATNRILKNKSRDWNNDSFSDKCLLNVEIETPEQQSSEHWSTVIILILNVLLSVWKVRIHIRNEKKMKLLNHYDAH